MKVVILAGGLGTRMAEYTNTIPNNPSAAKGSPDFLGNFATANGTTNQIESGEDMPTHDNHHKSHVAH